MMPSRFLILRLVIALMCLGFAWFWGRSVGRKSPPGRRGTGSLSWAIRTLVAGAALQWRTGPDLVSIIAYALAGLAWAGGFFLARRPEEPPEDLTREMFPDD